MANDTVSYDHIVVEAIDGIATVTINRPDRLNAMSQRTMAEMADAIERANRDHSVGVIVVTGAGERAFSAGGDLETVTSNTDQGRSDMGAAETLRWVNAFRQSAKPTIAKVRGYCIGLGNELNLLCDLTIASETARFGQAGPKVGSVPLMGGTQLLPLVCGLKRAKEVLFLCRTYSGDEAIRVGLANVVVPDDQLDAEVRQWAEELLAKSPQSLRIAKMSMSYLFDLQWPALQHGIELTSWMVASDEMREGTSAFMEKRAPNWRAKQR